MGEEWLRWSRFSGGEAARPLLLLPWSFIIIGQNRVSLWVFSLSGRREWFMKIVGDIILIFLKYP